jgi:hypothetical protein
LKNSYKFISGFPRFLDVLIGQKPCWKAAAVVSTCFGNLFLKHRKVSESPSQIVFKSPNLLAAFQNLFIANKKALEINFLCKKNIL